MTTWVHKRQAVYVLFSAGMALQAALVQADALLPDADSNDQLRSRWQQTAEQIKTREQSAIIDVSPKAEPVSAPQVAQSLLAALNHRQWQAVKDYLKQYVQYPNHEQDASLVALAQAALSAEEGNTAQALTQYREILQQYPQFVRARLDYARLLFQDNQMRESSEAFDAVLSAPGCLKTCGSAYRVLSMPPPNAPKHTVLLPSAEAATTTSIKAQANPPVSEPLSTAPVG